MAAYTFSFATFFSLFIHWHTQKDFIFLCYALSSVTTILNHYGLWSLKQDEVIISICGWEQAFKWCDLHFAANKSMIDDDYD